MRQDKRPESSIVHFASGEESSATHPRVTILKEGH